jgi:hypothetical protein
LLHKEIRSTNWMQRDATSLPITHRDSCAYGGIRFVYVAAVAGMAIAVLFITPLMETSPAHAVTGVNGYLRFPAAGISAANIIRLFVALCFGDHFGTTRYTRS